jgi:hypothetical protein
METSLSGKNLFFDKRPGNKSLFYEDFLEKSCMVKETAYKKEKKNLQFCFFYFRLSKFGMGYSLVIVKTVAQGRALILIAILLRSNISHS